MDAVLTMADLAALGVATMNVHFGFDANRIDVDKFTADLRSHFAVMSDDGELSDSFNWAMLGVGVPSSLASGAVRYPRSSPPHSSPWILRRSRGGKESWHPPTPTNHGSYV